MRIAGLTLDYDRTKQVKMMVAVVAFEKCRLDFQWPSGIGLVILVSIVVAIVALTDEQA